MNKVLLILGLLAVASALSACPRTGPGGTAPEDGPLYLGIYLEPRSPGMIIDSTMWDLATAGEQNKKIALDPQGGIQTTLRWAPTSDPSWPSRRSQIWTSDRGWWYSDPRKAEAYLWGGCGTMDVLSDGRSVQAFHDSHDGSSFFAEVAVDSARGRGKFNHFWPDSLSSARMCPLVAVDDSDYIHVLADWVYYTRSTDQGNTWTPFEFVSSEVMYYDRAIIASKRTGKLCRAWARFDTVGNIYWQVSKDHGRTWSATKWIPGVRASDTMQVYSDFDVAFDQEDSLHFVFTLLMGSKAQLAHYSRATGLTRVASAWWPSDRFTSSPPYIYGSIARPTLGLDEHDHLWCAWAQYDTSDVADNAVSNGEIYLASSIDGGMNWSAGVNLTNTPTPNCTSGNCEDDGYPNIAGIINDTLHLWYQDDREAGCQKWGVDPGDITMNPILYLRIPITPSGSAEVPGSRPLQWSTPDVFPNPFLSLTRVRGHEQESFVVYDLTGRRVRTYPGDRIGEGLPAGVYFIKAEGGSAKPLRIVKVR